MYIVNINNVELKELKKGDAVKTYVKYLLDRDVGAKKFFLRYYVVEKGGKTPLDKHPYEHEIYVLSGKGAILREDKGVPRLTPIGPGDSIFVASNEVHQLINIGDEPLTFLCVKGAEELY